MSNCFYVFQIERVDIAVNDDVERKTYVITTQPMPNFDNTGSPLIGATSRWFNGDEVTAHGSFDSIESATKAIEAITKDVGMRTREFDDTYSVLGLSNDDLVAEYDHGLVDQLTPLGTQREFAELCYNNLNELDDAALKALDEGAVVAMVHKNTEDSLASLSPLPHPTALRDLYFHYVDEVQADRADALEA